MIALVLGLLAAVGDNIENVITDPYGTFVVAFGDFAPVVILAIFMTGIALIYMKTQSFVPALTVFVIGSMLMATLLPANDIIQKFMFLLVAIGIVAMLFYAFAKKGDY